MVRKTVPKRKSYTKNLNRFYNTFDGGCHCNYCQFMNSGRLLEKKREDIFRKELKKELK